MKAGTARFGRDRRIRKSHEFGAILKAGARLATPLLNIAVVPASGPGRIGISAPAQMGGAVQRNRSRRLVREYYRQTFRGSAPYDIVVNLKPGFAELSAIEAGRALAEALEKVGSRGKGARRHARLVH